MVLSNFNQSTLTFQSSEGSDDLAISVDLKKLAKLTDPRLHDSFPNRGCSPQGLVAIISPYSDTTLLSLFIVSKNTIPGSPFLHAP